MNKTVDIRVRLFAVIAGSFLAFLLKSEEALTAAFMLAFLWACAFKCWQTAFTAALLYALLFWMGQSVYTNPILSSLWVVSLIFRRMLIPLLLALPLSKAPVGMLIATLGRIRIPKPVTVSLALMLRFMPTLAQEYRAIRISQKFRGIGVNAWGLLCRPVRSYETLIVPLLIRTTRIADELSASAMLRGAAEKGETSSYYDIRFKTTDVLWAVVIAVVIALLFILDSLNIKFF
jgi:energy-coupling factor transporter transmembrane protein EcfT